MIDGIKRKSTIYVGDSIVRKTDSRLNKGEDVVVCLPGARIEHVTDRVEKIMGRGKGGNILVHIGTNNADKEGTTAIVDKYRTLLKKTKEARVEQIILSGILTGRTRTSLFLYVESATLLGITRLHILREKFDENYPGNVHIRHPD